MKTVVGFFSAPPVELNVALSFGGGFALYGVERNASIYDTRFLPGNKEPADQARYLYLLLEGRFEWVGGEVFEGPAAFVASAEAFDGANGQRRLAFRAGGERFRAVQLRVAGDELGELGGSVQTPVSFSAGARQAVVAYLERLDVETRNAAAGELLRCLHEDGVLRSELSLHSELIDVVYENLWQTLFPVFERFAFGTTRAELGERAASSSRDPRYDMNKLAGAFNFGFAGWREFARRCRIQLAVLLLSNPNIAIRDIAKLVGYSTTEAFTHALYADELPAPGVIRQSILDYP